MTIVCFLTPMLASEVHNRVDLKKILESPARLERVTLMWTYPPNVSLFVYGDGRLILQSYSVIPDDPDNPNILTRRNGLVPTCKAKTSTDDVRALIQLMLEKHFFDLPEKSFLYQTAAMERRKLELHTIAVDDGNDRAGRTFGVGKYGDEDESLPADFVAIEDALTTIRDARFLKAGRPCGVAFGIKFGSEPSD